MTTTSIAYQWRIEQLDSAPSANNLSNVVRRVHWRLLGNDGENTAELYGELMLAPPSPEAFTPYDELTQEQVGQWVEETIDARAAVEDSGERRVAQLREGLAGILAARRTPPIVSNPLPWQ
jgi:hypothetical protein